MDDFYATQADLDEARLALLSADAGTEVVVFATHKGRTTDSRRSAGGKKRALFSCFANQAGTIYHRHLSAQGASSAANSTPPRDWDEAVFIDAGQEDQDGVDMPASERNSVMADFDGDDHALVMKFTVKPTVLRFSLRFTERTP